MNRNSFLRYSEFLLVLTVLRIWNNFSPLNNLLYIFYIYENKITIILYKIVKSSITRMLKHR